MREAGGAHVRPGAAFKLLEDYVTGLKVGDLTLTDDKTVETSFFTSSRKSVLFISRDDGAALVNGTNGDDIP